MAHVYKHFVRFFFSLIYCIEMANLPKIFVDANYGFLTQLYPSCVV